MLTDALIRAFGEKRAPLELGVTSLLFGFPIFFDAGLVVMLPIIFTIARRLGGSLLLYAMPAAMAFSAMHIFVPPHPGPVAASGLLGANVGDRKSTRLNSSHVAISYAVFCLKKKKPERYRPVGHRGLGTRE